MNLYDWPTWSIVLALLALMFAANELGYYFGRQLPEDEPEPSRVAANALKTSIFGLVAFLLAIAFSITSGRYDLRRRVVLDEANAIGTLYLRADVLEASARTRIQALLRELVDLRLEYFSPKLKTLTQVSTTTKSDRGTAEMDHLLAEVWAVVAESARNHTQLTHASQIIPAANEVIDLQTTRSWAVHGHLPAIVLMLLVACVLVSNVLIGHSSGHARRRHGWLWSAFNVLFALVLFVVLDFDRPQRGLIQIDHTPLLELQANLTSAQRN